MRRSIRLEIAVGETSRRRIQGPAQSRYHHRSLAERGVQSDCPPGLIDNQSAGRQSPCGSVVCPTSMM